MLAPGIAGGTNETGSVPRSRCVITQATYRRAPRSASGGFRASSQSWPVASSGSWSAPGGAGPAVSIQGSPGPASWRGSTASAPFVAVLRTSRLGFTSPAFQ